MKRQTVNGKQNDKGKPASLQAAWAQWQAEGETFWQQMDKRTTKLDELTENS